jgi:hypothetical protein
MEKNYLLVVGEYLSDRDLENICKRDSNLHIIYTSPFNNLLGLNTRASHAFEMIETDFKTFEDEIESRFDEVCCGSIDPEIHRIWLYPIIVEKWVVDKIVKSYSNISVYKPNYCEKIIKTLRQVWVYKNISYQGVLNCVSVLARLVAAIFLLIIKRGRAGYFGNRCLAFYLKRKNSKWILKHNISVRFSGLSVIQKTCGKTIEYLVAVVEKNYGILDAKSIRFNCGWSPICAHYIGVCKQNGVISGTGLHGYLWEPLLHRKFNTDVFYGTSDNLNIFYSNRSGKVVVENYCFEKVNIERVSLSRIPSDLNIIIYLTCSYTGMSLDSSYWINFRNIAAIKIRYPKIRVIVRPHPSESSSLYKKYLKCAVAKKLKIYPPVSNVAYVGIRTSALYSLKKEGYRVYEIIE